VWRWLVWLQPTELRGLRRYLVRYADPGAHDHACSCAHSDSHAHPSYQCAKSHARAADIRSDSSGSQQLQLAKGLLCEPLVR